MICINTAFCLDPKGTIQGATGTCLKHPFLIHLSAGRSPFLCVPPAGLLSAGVRALANPQLGTCLSYKSPTLKKEPKGVRNYRLTANSQSLAHSLHSLEIYRSSLRRKVCFLVLFLKCLTWNSCLLQQGPLGDRRIPCCPRTGWRL